MEKTQLNPSFIPPQAQLENNIYKHDFQMFIFLSFYK